MPKVLVGFYATEFALGTLVAMVLAFFGWTRQLPSDFSKDSLGRLVRLLGFIMQVFRRLLTLFHYITAILLLVMLGQVANGQCKVSVTEADYTQMTQGSKQRIFAQTNMQLEGSILIGVLLGTWVLTSLSALITKRKMHVDPQFAVPEDPTANRFTRCLCH